MRKGASRKGWSGSFSLLGSQRAIDVCFCQFYLFLNDKQKNGSLLGNCGGKLENGDKHENEV